jgi:hypothetical protein
MSNLPPGVTSRMIDEAYGVELPCSVCGIDPADCICPECLVCGSQGEPECYQAHGLARSDAQIAAYRRAEEAATAEATAEAAYFAQLKAEEFWGDYWEKDDEDRQA